MIVSGYPTESIHLPSHHFSVRIARSISIIGGIIIALSVCSIFICWLVKTDFLFTLFGKTLFNLPTIVGLLGCSFTIFFYNIAKKAFLVFWSIINLGIGLVTVLIYFFHPLSFISMLSVINLRGGLIFLLLGYSLLISISRVHHRFHYSQLILFIALFLSLFGILESLYLLISTGEVLSSSENSLGGSLLFFILCQSFLLIKANRGFLGLITTDTNSSQFARFSLIYYLILPPILGILFLIEEKVGFLNNSSGRLAFLILAMMLISVIITWINVKVLYPVEVENYLTKEALRINNITLKLDEKDLSSKVEDIEKAKKTLSDKLTNRESLLEYVDQLD